jgi:hypothetical protein
MTDLQETDEDFGREIYSHHGLRFEYDRTDDDDENWQRFLRRAEARSAVGRFCSFDDERSGPTPTDRLWEVPCKARLFDPLAH